jgi:MFS family permease
VLTAWALHVRADTSTIALLQGLSTGAQILHGPAGFVTAWIGRRRLAITALMAARLVWAPMALLPLLDPSPHTAALLLVVVAALSATFQVLGQNAWGAWISDIVPPTLRGRYFGARTVFVTGGAALASLASALVLDSDWPRSESLPMIAALLCATGFVSAALLSNQIDPAERTMRISPDVSAYVTALRDPRARALVYYQFAWGVAVAPGAAFFSLYALDALRADFLVLSAHAMVVALVRVVAAPLWGRVVDQWGARPVLVHSSLGIALMPMLWVFTTPDRLWPLAIDAIISGVMWGGHAVASFDLPLGIAPAEKRSYYLALFAMASGLGFVGSTLIAGFITDDLATTRGDLHPLFVFSALGRAACALIAVRVHDGRHALVPIRALG